MIGFSASVGKAVAKVQLSRMVHGLPVGSRGFLCQASNASRYVNISRAYHVQEVIDDPLGTFVRFSISARVPFKASSDGKRCFEPRQR